MRSVKLNPPKILNIQPYQKALKDLKLTPKQYIWPDPPDAQNDTKPTITTVSKKTTIQPLSENNFELW